MNIVHGDLKSVCIVFVRVFLYTHQSLQDNVLVSPLGLPLLMDFGISHLLQSTSTFETATDCSKGSTRWMAIELFDVSMGNQCGAETHSFSSDVWAFGMTALVSKLLLLIGRSHLRPRIRSC